LATFFLVGEITGSRGDAVRPMQFTGLDAALGSPMRSISWEGTATGRENPARLLAVPQLKTDR